MSVILEQLSLQVKEIIGAIARRHTEEVELHCSLVNDLGIDSIQMLELLSSLEDAFGFELDVDDIRPEAFRSVQSVVQFVRDKVAS